MRWLYCNPDDDGTRATELGCGWFPTVPAGYAATAPCVILHGPGQPIVIPDDGSLTLNDVLAAAQPLVAAEALQDNNSRPATVAVQVDPQAVTDAQAVITATTTIAGLRKAVTDALNLLNPGT